MKHVIGISGKIGHGKDVIASYLVREYGFVIVRMSDALKDELATRLPRTCRAIASLQGLGDVPLRNLIRDLKPAGIRELLQEYGTEVRRGDDPDYWTKQWARAAAKYARVVVPDIRFYNEAQAVTLAGGDLWAVKRPGTPAGSDHDSERFVDEYTGFDRVFWNDGTIENLEAAVAHTMGRDYGLTRRVAA